MKISYNWLKDYIIEIPSPEKTAEILTDIGLEVEGLEKYESIKGGLEGVVVGEVLTCEKHPNADKLSVTTVDAGMGRILPVVCGAPNVAAGQKVAIALPGTTLHLGDDSLSLKKVKIRGEVSEGMICAEDELGLGNSHDGILVLDEDLTPGTALSEVFDVVTDYVFEIGLTPNRIDAASHYGVARDLAAYLHQKGQVTLSRPSTDKFKSDNREAIVEVVVKNTEACPRYSGLTLSGIKVKESPEWLKNKLKAIGMSPINNIVDITNFVLHETGQPLHAFDLEKINGRKVIVQTLPEGTPFTTLDEVERKLSADDLMICDETGGMCIAGVFGGAESGVSDRTSGIFLESACFNPVYVRKTAKRHILNTDSSFRFERGSDPENTVYALKRAAILIQELAGGKISSDIIDIYPNPVPHHPITLSWKYLNTLIGQEIEKEKVVSVLENLDIQVKEQTATELHLLVPPYRVDVRRPADVVEEVLRIYGYNNIEIDNSVHSTLSYLEKPDPEKINHLISELLSANGFSEIMTNSLSKASYYAENDSSLVSIFNPLSSDLSAMRKTLLFGGLEAILYNHNRQNQDLRFYELGNVYRINPDTRDENPHKKYEEEFHLALWITGKKKPENWISKAEYSDFFSIRKYVRLVLNKLGISEEAIEIKETNEKNLSLSLGWFMKNELLLTAGIVASELTKKFDIEQSVFFAEFRWDSIIKLLRGKTTQFKPVSRFPEVRRDLSMILDRDVKFSTIRDMAFKTEKKLLKKVEIFDVYESGNIEKGKKSYALSFILQDENQTLNDKQIDKVMKKLSSAFEQGFNARIRS